MINPSTFCEPGETIGGIEANSTGCITYLVNKPGRGENDRVLLDVRTESVPCILIGGNSFTIETLHGIGRVALVDTESGAQISILLKPGVDVIIPIGVICTYYNCGQEGSQLVLRDTSEDFDLANEITAQEMVARLCNIFSPTVN